MDGGLAAAQKQEFLDELTSGLDRATAYNVIGESCRGWDVDGDHVACRSRFCRHTSTGGTDVGACERDVLGGGVYRLA